MITLKLMFMRKLLNAPLGTHKEMLYLELAYLPFRISFKEEGYLQYLVQEDPSSMLHRFLYTQVKKKNVKVRENINLKGIKELKIDLIIE